MQKNNMLRRRGGVGTALVASHEGHTATGRGVSSSQTRATRSFAPKLWPAARL